MLERLDELARQGRDFAFESTLASRSFAPFLRRCAGLGYEIMLLYVWLDSPELAVQRVASRVLSGGHFVPPDIVRRRYERGMANFASLYAPLCDTWMAADNSRDGGEPQVIARGGKELETTILVPQSWQQITAAPSRAAEETRGEKHDA